MLCSSEAARRPYGGISVQLHHKEWTDEFHQPTVIGDKTSLTKYGSDSSCLVLTKSKSHRMCKSKKHEAQTRQKVLCSTRHAVYLHGAIAQIGGRRSQDLNLNWIPHAPLSNLWTRDGPERPLFV